MPGPYIFITTTGIIVVDTSAILEQVTDNYLQVFGSDLVTTPNTPQGMFITVDTIGFTSVANASASLANQMNPNLSGGIFLYSIGALTGIEPTAATPSSVTVTLTGVTGTVIAQGSQAADSVYGNVFQTTEDVTLVAGTATVLMTSVENGPIVAGAGTLTVIISNILGWETVTNADSAVLGTLTQSDEEFRQYRQVTLAAQGASTAGAIIAEVAQVPGVVGAPFFRENIYPTTMVIDGITLVGHSIYVSVNGGTDLDVAEAILRKKSGGSAFNNGASMTPVSQDVTVPESGQVITVLFDRPDIIQIAVKVSVIVNTPVQDPITAVQDAILNYAAGLLDGLAGLIVGADVSPWELGSAITNQYPGIYVQDLQIQNITDSGSYQYETIDIDGWQLAQIQRSSIGVTVL